MRFIGTFYGKAGEKLNAVELGKSYLHPLVCQNPHTRVGLGVRVVRKYKQQHGDIVT